MTIKIQRTGYAFALVQESFGNEGASKWSLRIPEVLACEDGRKRIRRCTEGGGSGR